MGLRQRFIQSRGFTLLELMVVISIIAIFLAIVIPTYSRSILAAHENQLRSELSQLREAIWRYTFDKQKAPQSLDDLRVAGYIDRIPDDPMLLDFDGSRILTDPTFDPAPNDYPSGPVTLHKLASPAIEPEKLGSFDYVLLSHADVGETSRRANG